MQVGFADKNVRPGDRVKDTELYNLKGEKIKSMKDFNCDDYISSDCDHSGCAIILEN